LGAVYKTLDRMEGKGYVASTPGEATAERGGRSRRVYRLTAGGLRRLRASLASLEKMTDGLRHLLEPQ
jgi:DNA-binding PadR family transcriptional regulator